MLYEKRYVDALLANISNSLAFLETLFPAVVDVQKALCAIEVEEVQGDLEAPSNRSLLSEATEADADTLLA